MTDLEEFVSNTREVLSRIDPNADVILTSFETADQLKKEIDRDLQQLEQGNLDYLQQVYLHFLPTSTFQEIYIDEKWEIEMLDFCARMDELYARLKPIHPSKKSESWWKKIVG